MPPAPGTISGAGRPGGGKKMAGRIAGKVAIVTGGAQGNGGATVRRFVAEGARVVLTDIQEDKGAALARELGPDALFVRLDATRTEGWGPLIEQTTRHFGGLDILVNNVGGAPSVRYFLQEDEAWFRHVMD